MTRRSNAPYWIQTRYGGRCSRCGFGIKKGSDALYYPVSRVLLCAGDGCGKKDQRDMDAEKADEAVYHYGVGQ